MNFPEVLAAADEDLRRAMSEYRHHYPVEETITDDDGAERLHVRCGCDGAGREYGHLPVTVREMSEPI